MCCIVFGSLFGDLLIQLLYFLKTKTSFRHFNKHRPTHCLNWYWFIETDSVLENIGKVHIFWEGHKFLQNLHHRFVLCSNGQIYGEDFAIFCDLLRIYQLYKTFESNKHIFWEGHIILWNLQRRFDWHYIGQIYGGDFEKICGLLRIYKL